MYNSIKIKKGEGRFLKKGGLWIYDNEVAEDNPQVENGSIVDVLDFDGYFLGTGIINYNSKIRIRMLSRKKGTVIDHSFLYDRIRTAYEYRKKTVDMSCCRLIFAEADFIPGIVVDKFSDVLVIQSQSFGMDRYKQEILGILKELLKEDGITVKGIYERSDAKVIELEGLPRSKGFIGEEFDTKVLITENNVKYYVDIVDGQKTGFFLDQKYNRLAVQKLCKSARVLDCFTHTGSFALNAGIAGAEEVIGVDASQIAILQAEENSRLNGLQDKVSFKCADVFDFLPGMYELGQRFDVVILDPPAFTKSRESVKNASKGYYEINLAGMKLIKDGGFLATCSCSHFMTPELFSDAIGRAAKAAHKRLRQVEYRTQSPDHPILWNADESYYLKFYIFQVVDEK